jgi:hypothetical protein
MRSPSALEIARFLQKAAEEDFLVSYCLSGVHKNWYIIRAMRQNSKKGIDKSLFRVYSRVVKWIHYHRLNIKILKRRCRDSRNSKIPGRSFQNEKGL